MAAISKLEYLKRYMVNDNDNKTNKEKKKKKRAKKTNNITIIDSDIKFHDKSDPGNCDSDEFAVEDEKPQVFVDGLTLLSEHLEKNQGKEEGQKWAPLTSKDNDHLSSNNFGQKSDSPDLSPKRPRKRHDSPDLSPKRPRKRHDSPDLSPKRPRKRHDSPDLSPKRPRKRHDSPDLSPKRPRKRHDSPDLSPKRPRKRHDSPDLSPKRPRKRHDSPNLSPTRKGDRQISPPSPPNRIHKTHDDGRGRKEMKPEIIKTGKTSGLQSADLLREENQRKRVEEDAYFARMENSLSGKGTDTVYRDKSGKRIDPKLERIKKRELEEEKAKEDEKFLKWGKGIKQTDEYAKKLDEDIYEMSKPLARYKDDTDLDAMLRTQDRAGDPMLEFMRKSSAKAKDKKEKPRYKGPNPPPNRFSIWPGYRWDGVDRSNGFEKKRFGAIAERKSVAIDSYKWSVEDM
eukprot:gene328-960_t